MFCSTKAAHLRAAAADTRAGKGSIPVAPLRSNTSISRSRSPRHPRRCSRCADLGDCVYMHQSRSTARWRSRCVCNGTSLGTWKNDDLCPRRRQEHRDLPSTRLTSQRAAMLSPASQARVTRRSRPDYDHYPLWTINQASLSRGGRVRRLWHPGPGGSHDPVPFVPVHRRLDLFPGTSCRVPGLLCSARTHALQRRIIAPRDSRRSPPPYDSF